MKVFWFQPRASKRVKKEAPPSHSPDAMSTPTRSFQIPGKLLSPCLCTTTNPMQIDFQHLNPLQRTFTCCGRNTSKLFENFGYSLGLQGSKRISSKGSQSFLPPLLGRLCLRMCKEMLNPLYSGFGIFPFPPIRQKRDHRRNGNLRGFWHGHASKETRNIVLLEPNIKKKGKTTILSA